MIRKIIALFLAAAMCFASCISVFAASQEKEFDPTVSVDAGTSTITVTVYDESGLLEEKTPSLSVPCSFESASVTHEGIEIESVLSGGEISFAVGESGEYIISDASTSPVGPAGPSGPSDPADQPAVSEEGKSYPKIADDSYIDVKESDWFAGAVGYVTDEGLFAGVGNGKFGPEITVNRAMVMTVLAKYDGHDCAVTSGNWWDEGLKWAVENGVSDGTNPTAEITREQMVVMLWNYAGKPGSDHDLAAFADSESVSYWAEPAVKWAVENGIIAGVGHGKLEPLGYANRAQLAQIMVNFIKAVEKTEISAQ